MPGELSLLRLLGPKVWSLVKTVGPMLGLTAGTAIASRAVAGDSEQSLAQLRMGRSLRERRALKRALSAKADSEELFRTTKKFGPEEPSQELQILMELLGLGGSVRVDDPDGDASLGQITELLDQQLGPGFTKRLQESIGPDHDPLSQALGVDRLRG